MKREQPRNERGEFVKQKPEEREESYQDYRERMESSKETLYRQYAQLYGHYRM